METAEIRRRWLRFFESKGHAVVPSSPLLYDDPNLLFVNAGMVQFVPYFLGQQTAPWTSAPSSVQKCMRTRDIDEVGKTSRHGTFFQMNGNFSFGDYFKDGAIPLRLGAAHRRRSEGGYGLDPERLWATVYLDDDEAVAAVGRADRHARRADRAPRAWPTTSGRWACPGRAGPRSEIFYDRGPAYGAEGGPAVDEDRYMEIWNLVFMQNDPRRGQHQGGLPDPRRAAGEEHRHRHGPGADGRGAAGRATTSTRSTRSTRSSSAPPSSPASGTARTPGTMPRTSRTPTTSGCGSSPTTCAPR